MTVKQLQKVLNSIKGDTAISKARRRIVVEEINRKIAGEQ